MGWWEEVKCDACGRTVPKGKREMWAKFTAPGEKEPRYVCPEDVRKGYIKDCFDGGEAK